jgi:WS/DGAT/MGAT family acyltransferase
VAFARCPLADLKEVRRAFDTTINDVVLAATTASLRQYLLARGIRPDQPLVASVPVALQRDSATPSFGNHVSNMMVSLPVQLDDPVDALRSIHEDALGAKAVQQALGPDVLEDLVGLAPAALLTVGARAYSALGLGRFHPPLFNAVVSNVPGPPVPLYVAGARVLATYPMGPLIGNTGLNLTVLSQTGDLDVGVIACPDLVDDVGAIATGFVAGVAALLDAAHLAPGV